MYQFQITVEFTRKRRSTGAVECEDIVAVPFCCYLFTYFLRGKEQIKKWYKTQENPGKQHQLPLSKSVKLSK